jgi:hypothetical protein
MDLARGSERQSVDDDGMNCTVAQQLEQRGHVGLHSRPADIAAFPMAKRIC